MIQNIPPLEVYSFIRHSHVTFTTLPLGRGVGVVEGRGRAHIRICHTRCKARTGGSALVVSGVVK